MAAFNVVTSVRQDAIVAKLLPVVNAERVLRSLPTYTLPQYVQSLLDDAASVHISRDDQAENARIAEAYSTASIGARAAVRAQLGIV